MTNQVRLGIFTLSPLPAIHAQADPDIVSIIHEIGGDGQIIVASGHV